VLFLALTVIAPAPPAHAQSDDVRANVNVLVKSQLRGCLQMCASETKNCLDQQDTSVPRETKERFCNTADIGCTAGCSDCIGIFASCMKSGDQTIHFCQDPFNACLEQKFNASSPR
jgi:hypothetical protein